MSALASTATAAAVLKDYSGTASGLFNNMRTPAALIGGTVVSLGVTSAPPIKENDSSFVKLFKKANLLLGVASLLSEILAVTYSSVAINKLAEIKFEPTQSVDDLISEHFKLEWVGTNVHFLMGMFGFGLLMVPKPILHTELQSARLRAYGAWLYFCSALRLSTGELPWEMVPERGLPAIFLDSLSNI